MLPRILFEIFLLIVPFIAFGIYRFAIRDAEIEGRKAWPIKALFGIGLVLAVGFWLFLILRADRTNDCNRPAYRDAETGKLIPAQSYDCNISFDDLGVPQSEDPGGDAGPAADPE
jgi:hypothetical protein